MGFLAPHPVLFVPLFEDRPERKQKFHTEVQKNWVDTQTLKNNFALCELFTKNASLECKEIKVWQLSLRKLIPSKAKTQVSIYLLSFHWSRRRFALCNVKKINKIIIIFRQPQWNFPAAKFHFHLKRKFEKFCNCWRQLYRSDVLLTVKLFFFLLDKQACEIFLPWRENVIVLNLLNETTEKNFLSRIFLFRIKFSFYSFTCTAAPLVLEMKPKKTPCRDMANLLIIHRRFLLSDICYVYISLCAVRFDPARKNSVTKCCS